MLLLFLSDCIITLATKGYIPEEFQIILNKISVSQFPYNNGKDSSNNLPHGFVARF